MRTKDKKIITVHNLSECTDPYIISRPGARIEKTTFWTKRFYSESSWVCLNCKWQSETIRTRTT